MSNPDKQVIVIIIIAVIVYISAWVSSLYKRKLVKNFYIINTFSAITIIIYQLQHEARVVQHNIDAGEITLLSFECLIIGLTVFLILTGGKYYWSRLLQYIIFGIHFTALVAFLIFMLSFKITKLF